MKKSRGFSLLELLIVVAIILIIATIAIPSLLRSRQAMQAMCDYLQEKGDFQVLAVSYASSASATATCSAPWRPTSWGSSAGRAPCTRARALPSCS